MALGLNYLVSSQVMGCTSAVRTTVYSFLKSSLSSSLARMMSIKVHQLKAFMRRTRYKLLWGSKRRSRSSLRLISFKDSIRILIRLISLLRSAQSLRNLRKMFSLLNWLLIQTNQIPSRNQNKRRMQMKNLETLKSRSRERRPISKWSLSKRDSCSLSLQAPSFYQQFSF